MLFDEYQEQHEEQHEQQYITKHCCSISWYQNNVVWRVPGMAWMTVHYQTLLFYTLVSKQWCLVSHGTPLSRNNNVFCWRRNGTTLFVHGAERNIVVCRTVWSNNVVLHVVERNSVVGARRREKRRCLCRETPLRVAVSRAASSSLSATHRTPVFLCGVNSMRLLRQVVDKTPACAASPLLSAICWHFAIQCTNAAAYNAPGRLRPDHSCPFASMTTTRNGPEGGARWGEGGAVSKKIGTGRCSPKIRNRRDGTSGMRGTQKSPRLPHFIHKYSIWCKVCSCNTRMAAMAHAHGHGTCAHGLKKVPWLARPLLLWNIGVWSCTH